MTTDRKTFFSSVRTSLFGGSLSQDQVDGMGFLLDAFERAGWSEKRWWAYALATAFHETNRTMQPIREIGGYAYFERNYGPTGRRPDVARRNGNTQPGDGARYCGRGYVQLTWKNNYRAVSVPVSEAIGETIDLVATPDRAMEPAIAAVIMIFGMETGLFTGRYKLADFILFPKADYVGARRIINGTDKAKTIAGYAQKFAAALGV